VPEEDPSIPTAARLWKSALWAEREVWDMFGIRFADHPDLRRLLMYTEFVGHPLRKDYPLNQRQPLIPERDPIAEAVVPGDARSALVTELPPASVVAEARDDIPAE